MRRAGKTRLDYPGGVGRVAQAVDADLLARAIAWSGQAEAARNEIFNVTNGDVFVWPNVWPAIADALGFDAGEHVPLSLDKEIRPREAEWAEICAAHGLRLGHAEGFRRALVRVCRLHDGFWPRPSPARPRSSRPSS